MKLRSTVDFNFPYCILCKVWPPDSLEHIIPKVLGGRLSAQILCSACNHAMGTQLVSQIKDDPYIRVCFEHLIDTHRKIYERLQPLAKYRVEAGLGASMVLVRKKNELKQSIGGQDPLGVGTFSADQAMMYVSGKLRKAGVPSDELLRILGDLSDLPKDIEYSLPNGQTFVNRSTSQLPVDMTGTPISDRLTVLIAYEFLALVAHSKIYTSYFDEIRDYIINGTKCEKVGIFRDWTTRPYSEPFHTLVLEPGEQYTCVTFVVFGRLKIVVTFLSLNSTGHIWTLIEDLREPDAIVFHSE